MFISCRDRPNSQIHEKKPQVSFKTFEISYSNGWTPGFTILIDSNKVYFSHYTLDSIFYGILPDSIFSLVDSSAIDIKKDTTIKSNKFDCDDCATIAIRIETLSDTIKIFRAGGIHPKLSKLVATLSEFNNAIVHNQIPSQITFKTRIEEAVDWPIIR